MNKKKLIINSTSEMIEFGEKLGKELKPNMIITLLGDLGAGKTTLTKGIAKGLGINSIINSPTFTIMKIHQGKMPLFHMDVYRLDNSTGDDYLEEYFYMDGVCVIEWATNLSDIIPDERLELYIRNIDETTRDVELIASGSDYEKLLERVFCYE